MIFLGIDCGTQSTKAVALDWETGTLLASASQAYGFLPNLPPGAMEQDPAQWISAADETVRKVLTDLGARKSDVRGIGVSGQQHGLVPLDARGDVVRAAKLWCDTSTAPQCDEITRHFGGCSEVIRRVGNAMLPGYTAPKILWLRQNEPDNWEKTTTVLLPHDYLNYWLTGHVGMEYGDASGTALLNLTTREWAPDVVDFVAPDLAEKLPPLQPSSKPAGMLKSSLAKAWGLTGDVLISSGGGDNMMGAIGTGNIRAGVVTASLGTSGTLFAFSGVPVTDPRGEVAGFCDSTDHWLPLVCTMNLTLITEHVRNLFAWDFPAMDAALSSVKPGAEGLLMLPYLTGERTPNLPQGTGILHGLTIANFTPAHLARAATESVTLGLGYGLRRLRELGVAPQEIRLTGGGSNSKIWRGICADVFGVPVVCLKSGEGAGLGAAIQAGWTFGGSSDLSGICSRMVALDESSRVEPNAKNTELYCGLLEKSGRLREALREKDLL
ncbi:MAG: xylulokinase [Chthoniobacterales bacterium]|nr:xylulokinase [Chthoniobacterales bacterium]